MLHAAAVLVGLLSIAGSEPPQVPDEEALEIAEAAFVASVSSGVGEPELVACAIDAFIQCYATVFGETLDDPATLVIQTGWIDDDGEFFTPSEPRLISLAADEHQADSPDDVREQAEEYLMSYEFEVDAELFGRVENPRCETPDTAEPRETFDCRFDMVTNENVFTMTARFRITELGGVEATQVDFVE